MTLPENLSAAMPIEHCGFVSKCMANPASYASEAPGARWGMPNTKAVAGIALRRLEEARAKDIEAHERNALALANNKALREHLLAVMKAAGIPDSFSERDLKSRARYPKSIKRDAGYLGDLQRNVKTYDNFEFATQTYQRLKATYDTYAKEAEGEAERKAAAAAAEDERRKAERRANIELATIVLRYGLDPDVEWSDVLEALRRKDQRCDLAVAMRHTRGDWSEGPYRVNEALGRFTITTDEDKDIANDIVQHLSDWDGDGRVFRDTAWSYDRLFQSVADQQLVTDVLLAIEKAEQ